MGAVGDFAHSVLNPQALPAGQRKDECQLAAVSKACLLPPRTKSSDDVASRVSLRVGCETLAIDKRLALENLNMWNRSVDRCEWCRRDEVAKLPSNGDLGGRQRETAQSVATTPSRAACGLPIPSLHAVSVSRDVQYLAAPAWIRVSRWW